MSDKYQTAVTEARQLVKRSEEDQWRLAELTWQQVEGGKSRRQWAKDIGVAASHANYLYAVWDRFGAQHVGTRPRYATAYEAVQHNASPEEAHEKAEDARAIGRIRSAAPERKAEVVRELLTDPDVADVAIDAAVKASPRAAATASKALDDRVAAAPRPTVANRNTGDQHTEAVIAARQARKYLQQFADAVSGADFPPAVRQSFLPLLDDMTAALEMIRTGLTSGSWDDELADLLRRES